MVGSANIGWERIIYGVHGFVEGVKVFRDDFIFSLV